MGKNPDWEALPQGWLSKLILIDDGDAVSSCIIGDVSPTILGAWARKEIVTDAFAAEAETMISWPSWQICFWLNVILFFGYLPPPLFPPEVLYNERGNPDVSSSVLFNAI